MKVNPQISVIKRHWFVKMNLHTQRKLMQLHNPLRKGKKKGLARKLGNE